MTIPDDDCDPDEECEANAKEALLWMRYGALAMDILVYEPDPFEAIRHPFAVVLRTSSGRDVVLPVPLPSERSAVLGYLAAEAHRGRIPDGPYIHRVSVPLPWGPG